MKRIVAGVSAGAASAIFLLAMLARWISPIDVGLAASFALIIPVWVYELREADSGIPVALFTMVLVLVCAGGLIIRGENVLVPLVAGTVLGMSWLAVVLADSSGD